MTRSHTPVSSAVVHPRGHSWWGSGVGVYGRPDDWREVRIWVLEACEGDDDLWELVRHKVRVVTPDGAPDEQLAGRLTSESFPKMMVVLRCAAHSINSAVAAGWRPDTSAQVGSRTKHRRSSVLWDTL